MTRYRTDVAARRTRNIVQGLHHHAYIARNLEETRHFYEDILGLPLIGTWVERHNPVTNQRDNYVHAFFELADGSCLAFFQFKDQQYNDQTAISSFKQNNPFAHHIALEVRGFEALEEMKMRLRSGDIPFVETDHGYCQSIYLYDPNGMQVEFTTQVPRTDEMFATVAPTAHDVLADWLSQECLPSNNEFRSKEGWKPGT
ncbi:MAG: VOC family protein [Beijerinckiaceae bacterium]